MKTARRNFIRKVLYSSALGLAGQSLFAKENKGEAIIIGAGISGLAAAQYLKNQGFKVTVLEARKRVGGRIWTWRDLACPVDLGASWIHGVKGNPITKLAQKHNIRLKPTNFDNALVFDPNGKQLSAQTLGELLEGTGEVMEAAAALANSQNKNLSVSGAITKALAGETLAKEEKLFLNWFMSTQEVESGASMSKLSLAYSNHGKGFGGDDHLFPGGYDQIIKVVGQGINVKTSHIVKQIEHNKQCVRVTTSKGTFEGDGVIVTLPLGVLKKQSVTFVPELPDWKKQAINRLGMGTLNKVAMQFSETFWPKENEFFGHISSKAGEFPVLLNMTYYANKPVLMAFTGGDFAQKVEKLSDEKISRELTAILSKIYGGKIPDIADGIATRWHSDPFAGGSYSHIPVGATPKDYDLMARPVGDRLYFAGEATIRDYPSTVHGAYLSGLRVAEHIAKL